MEDRNTEGLLANIMLSLFLTGIWNRGWLLGAKTCYHPVGFSKPDSVLVANKHGYTGEGDVVWELVSKIANKETKAHDNVRQQRPCMYWSPPWSPMNAGSYTVTYTALNPSNFAQCGASRNNEDQRRVSTHSFCVFPVP